MGYVVMKVVASFSAEHVAAFRDAHIAHGAHIHMLPSTNTLRNTRSRRATMLWVASCYAKPVWWRLGVGVAAALLGAALRLACMGLLENRLVYVTFYPAVVVAALLGGMASGGLATVLCALLAHLWVAPIANLGGWLGLALFLTVGVAISCVAEALHRIWNHLCDAEKQGADEDQLRIESERLRLAISAAAIGTWDLDVAANITQVSPEIREIFGYASDRLINPEVAFATLIPDDLPAMQAAFRAPFDPAGNGRYRAEYRIRRANDGEVRWISSMAQAFFRHGRPVRLVGISRDITNEKLAGQLLIEKAQLAEQLTSVAASLPGVICSFRQSVGGKLSMPYASTNFSRVYGLSPDDVRTDAGRLLQRVHPEDLSHVQASIAKSARTLTLWCDEFRYEHPQKGMIWLGGQSLPNFEPGGDIVWHGYVQDVTERKHAELALRATEVRCRALFDSGLLGIIFWNVNGAITAANDKFLEMLGYSREDLEAGRLDWVAMTAPEYHCIVEKALAELKATGLNRFPFEKESVRKDGTRLPVLVAGIMLDEEHLNGVAFVLDISERKEAEARMRKFHADRMNIMESMAAGLAHEINQPLAATVVYLQTLRRLLDMQPELRPARVSVTETLDKAAAQVTRAGQIVTGLRAFIAHGEPDKIPLKLHKLIQDACGVEAKERQARVRLQLNSEEDEVLADKVQIEQVLVNLIRNAKEAVEASDRREIVISTSSSGIDVRVEISDTGVGLSEKVKLSLFEPFVTTKVNGMGVGLSISRVIIEAHDGTIWAESNPKGGTVFGFRLPLYRPVLEDELHA
jgi:two-component system sensor kinase FixL